MKKIFLICSKAFYSQLASVKAQLEAQGWEVYIPWTHDKPEAESQWYAKGPEEHSRRKSELFRRSRERIRQMDAVLTLNFDKGGQENYIGGSTFLELYEAFMEGRKIYLWNDIPRGLLYDEISAFSPTVIYGDPGRIEPPREGGGPVQEPRAEYRAAAPRELERLWEKNVARHPGDARWARWREQYIGYNQKGMAATFAVVLNGEPAGEGTLLFSPECGAIAGRTALADGARVANVNALRIEKAYEGQGHISRLMRALEGWARARGFQALTIGVDAHETRNLGIYLHWGYDRFVMAEEEDGGLVLYYEKKL